MDSAQRNLAAEQQLGNSLGLGARVRKIQPFRDPAFEHIQVLGQHHARLNHVQVVQNLIVRGSQRHGQQISLLLIVAFQADAVAGPDHRLEQGGGIVRGHHLTLGVPGSRRYPLFFCAPGAVPGRHRAFSTDHPYSCHRSATACVKS
ncbi:hypothetical protein D3C73_993710 [compost metagenome]